MYLPTYATLSFVSLLSIGIATVNGLSQQPIQITSGDNGPFDTEFDAFVEATMHVWHVPGLSIAVVDNGTIFSKVLYSSIKLCFMLLPFCHIPYAEDVLSLKGLWTFNASESKSNRRHAILHR